MWCILFIYDTCFCSFKTTRVLKILISQCKNPRIYKKRQCLACSIAETWTKSHSNSNGDDSNSNENSNRNSKSISNSNSYSNSKINGKNYGNRHSKMHNKSNSDDDNKNTDIKKHLQLWLSDKEMFVDAMCPELLEV